MYTFVKYTKTMDDLVKASDAYYKGKPIMSDMMFDELARECAKFEDKYPDLARKDSVNKIIKDNVGAIPHPSKMWSQPDVFDINSTKIYISRILKKAKEHNIIDLGFIMEPKYDGVSINLIYKNGVLTDAITRGDGERGYSIFPKTKYIKGIPQYLKNLIDYDLIEIRGELIVTKPNLEKINSDREKNNLKPFKKSRNVVAGSLTLLDMDEFKSRLIEFMYWGVGSSILHQMKILI